MISPCVVADVNPLRVLGDVTGKCLALFGIGGGGDVISTVPVLLELQRLGARVLPGGLTWKRRAHDPVHRPRRIDEFTSIERIGEHVGVVRSTTRTHEGVMHVEAYLSQCLGDAPVIALDPSGGSAAVLRAFDDMRRTLGVDAFIGVDVGGDVLCAGHEPTLESPLCDQTMLCALHEEDALLLVASIGTDGEISERDLVARFEQLADIGGLRGVFVPNRDHIVPWEQIAKNAPTESSRFAPHIFQRLSVERIEQLCCTIASGPHGLKQALADVQPLPLRGGSRTGFTCDVTGLFLGFSSAAVWRSGRLGRLWEPQATIYHSHDILSAQGIVTEFSENQG